MECGKWFGWLAGISLAGLLASAVLLFWWAVPGWQIPTLIACIDIAIIALAPRRRDYAEPPRFPRIYREGPP